MSFMINSAIRIFHECRIRNPSPRLSTNKIPQSSPLIEKDHVGVMGLLDWPGCQKPVVTALAHLLFYSRYSWSLSTFPKSVWSVLRSMINVAVCILLFPIVPGCRLLHHRANTAIEISPVARIDIYSHPIPADLKKK